MKHHRQNWQGKAAIAPGIGAFIGRSGDNEKHKHWAHQISIALEEKVVVYADQQSISGKAIFIPANITHSLEPGVSLSIYIDPSTLLADKIRNYIDNVSSVCEVKSELADLILPCFQDNSDLQSGVYTLNHIFDVRDETTTNTRREAVLNRLQDVLRGEEVTRTELAQLTCLSPSRFSHWFKEIAICHFIRTLRRQKIEGRKRRHRFALIKKFV